MGSETYRLCWLKANTGMYVKRIKLPISNIQKLSTFVFDSGHHRTCVRYDAATSLYAVQEQLKGNSISVAETAVASNETGGETIASSAAPPLTRQSSLNDEFQSQRNIQARIFVMKHVLRTSQCACFGLSSCSAPHRK